MRVRHNTDDLLKVSWLINTLVSGAGVKPPTLLRLDCSPIDGAQTGMVGRVPTVLNIGISIYKIEGSRLERNGSSVECEETGIYKLDAAEAATDRPSLDRL